VLKNNYSYCRLNSSIFISFWSCANQGFAVFYATQAKERSYHNWHVDWFLLLLTIEIFSCLHKHVDVFLYDCVKCHLKFEKVKGLSFFFFDHFFLSKCLDHIIKDASIFHLKLSDSYMCDNFLIFTHLGHTSHHHGRSIPYHRFLT